MELKDYSKGVGHQVHPLEAFTDEKTAGPKEPSDPAANLPHEGCVSVAERLRLCQLPAFPGLSTVLLCERWK